ncbi:MAG: hypothetical protein IJC74_04930 [Clostridia bacterium]|nr:hypothetical protein [Clostridia bacterium]
MYGKFGNYFGKKQKEFRNSIWIELIGFEKNSPDYGVKEYIDTIGFVPDSISFHLTCVDYVNRHEGMEEEYFLPEYVCSYCGHEANDQRKRQNWTNYDMRSLVRILHGYGIKVFASFFDGGYGDESPFLEKHPEICRDGVFGESIIMIKRFADGSYYEDYLLKKMIEVAKDYELDGIQVADGISSPRINIWEGDFTADLIEQSGIEVPDGEDAKTYISKYKRPEWLKFYRNRWSSFLRKLLGGLNRAGIETQVNSAWTRDPLEAIYRYGTDYKVIGESGANYFMVEDVSSDLTILECTHVNNIDRKLVHYEYLANLMAINVYTNLHITPLFPIWDNLEQWDVVHHMPTLMQRGAAGNFTHFTLRNDRLTPITGGPHFCLGDALSKKDWDFIRLSIDNGYTPEAVDTTGATFIWSSARMENEIDALINYGNVHSTRWLALLMRNGASVSKMADISQLDIISGDIIVSNYEMLPKNEQKLIDSYKKGRVIKVGIHPLENVSNEINPIGWDWPETLTFAEIPEGYIEEKVALINENVNASIVEESEKCTINEIITGEKTSRIIIDNNEFVYALPTVHTVRKIKSIKIITKPEAYPFRKTDHEFKIRVAPRGVDIAEIEYLD